jgi:hypothetical protein
MSEQANVARPTSSAPPQASVTRPRSRTYRLFPASSPGGPDPGATVLIYSWVVTALTSV